MNKHIVKHIVGWLVGWLIVRATRYRYTGTSWNDVKEPRAVTQIVTNCNDMFAKLPFATLVWFGLVGLSFNASLEPQPRAHSL